MYFEVCEIGRESVKSVNATILAALIKELVNGYEKNHKYKFQQRKLYVRCREKLEFSPKKSKKNGDDEGFESDGNEDDSLSGDVSNEDAQSTTSSCCLVEDHVLKSTAKPDFVFRKSFGKDPTSLVSIIGSIDSANSSGSSDTDEIEVHSLTPSPIVQSKTLSHPPKQVPLFKTNEYESAEDKHSKLKREEYPISNVIFCHTDPNYSNVIAWVIKKPNADFGSRLGATGTENFSKIENCLEVVVVKCKNADNLRQLCSSYQEYSRRTKLDNYKSIKPKSDGDQKKIISLSPMSQDVKVSLSDMKIANSNLIKASELSILNPKIIPSFRTDMKNSVSLNSLIKTEKISNQATKINLPGTKTSVSSGTMPAAVKKTQSLLNIKNWEPELNGTLKSVTIGSEKVSDVGDQFNLVQRTDQNGVTHIEVTKSRDGKTSLSDKFSNKSKFRREIEGIILTDVESYGKKDYLRQMNDSLNAFNGADSVAKYFDCAPIRPERRKYVRKKSAAPSPPASTVVSDQKSASPQQKSKNHFFLSSFNEENRSKKDQKGSRSPFVELQMWRDQNGRDAGTRNWKPETRRRLLGKSEDKVYEKRSLSAGRPPKKVPMAYRYVYLKGDYHDSLPQVKRGISSKIREVGGNFTNSMNILRRRNSFDDVITYNDQTKSSLKSVIKKSKKINDKYCEPKKVTFSAFATVQVVD